MNEPFLVRLELKRTEETTGGYRHYGAHLYAHSKPELYRGEKGTAKLPSAMKLEVPDMGAMTLGQFLEGFRSGKGSIPNGGLQVGRWLYTCLFQEAPNLREHWKEARANWERTKRPLRLELVFPHPSGLADSEVHLEELPFELLADEQGLLFQRAGYTLVRCYGTHTESTLDIPRSARALLAWANPKEGSPEPIADEVFESHHAALKATFQGPLGWEVLPPCEHATPESLEARLCEAKPVILSIVAHGMPGGGALLLESATGAAKSVKPNELAAICRKGNVQLVMLWTCHGAAWRANTGSLAEALLNSAHGDVAAVIAAHGALEATGTGTLANALLSALASTQSDLDQALFDARMKLGEGNIQWALPVYYARPRDGRTVRRAASSEQQGPSRGLEDAPRAPPSFTGRQELLDQGLELLRREKEPFRFISVVGAPGIGKTAVVRSLADRAMKEFGIKSALWISADHTSVQDLRAHIAVWFCGQGAYDPEGYKHDRQLANTIGNTPLLLVFDSAEVYLWRHENEVRDTFLKLLRMLYSHCANLRVLLSTQEVLGTDAGNIQEGVLPVQALPPQEARSLFLSLARRNLSETTVPEEARALEDILAQLSGHPRSLVLVAGQIAQGRQPVEILALLKEGILESISHSNSNASVVDEKKTRDHRLISSFNLVYRHLWKKNQSAAEAFAWMGENLPAGATYELLKRIFQGEDWSVVPALQQENLVDEKGKSRLIIPAPLNIYAKGKADQVQQEHRQALLTRTFTAYAELLNKIRSHLGTPQGPQALQETLADTANVERLSNLLGKGISRSHCGQVFSSWAKIMLYAGPAERLKPVVERAVAYLRATDWNFRWIGGLYYRFRRLTATLLKQEPPLAEEPLAQVLEALGDVYARAGEAQRAEGSYHEALWRYQSVEDTLGIANVHKALGDLHAQRAQFQEAEAAYLQARGIYQTLGSLREEAETYKSLGDLYSRQEKRSEEALATYTKAQELSQRADWPLGEAHAYLLLGNIRYRLWQLTEAETAYEGALQLYRQLEWYPGVAEACKALGDIHEIGSAWEEAEDCYNEALQMYGKIESRQGEAATLRFLGVLFRKQSKYTESEVALASSRQLSEALGDRLGLAYTLTAQGDLYRMQAKYSEAEEALARALPIFEALGDRRGQANTLQSQGGLFRLQDKYREAEEALARALPIYEALGDRRGQAYTLQSQGALFRMQAKYSEAEEALARALQFAEALNDRLILANTLVRQGELFTKQDRLQDAERAYVKALGLARAINYPWARNISLQRLGELIARRGALEADTTILEEALTLYQETRNLTGETMVLKCLGDIEMRRNLYPSAYDCYLQAIKLAEQAFPFPVEEVADLYTHAARLAMAVERPELGLYWSTHALERLTCAPLAEARPGFVVALQLLADSAQTLGQPLVDEALRAAWHIATDLGHPDAPQLASRLTNQVPDFDPSIRLTSEELKNISNRILELMLSHDAYLRSRGINPRKPLDITS